MRSIRRSFQAATQSYKLSSYPSTH